MSRKKLKPKSKEMIREATDIVRNAESDEAAVAFLQDTLTDDFPDLDLGRMDLHEAVDSLMEKSERRKMSGSQKAISDINKSLDEFIKYAEDKASKQKQKKKKKKKRKKGK